MARNYRFVIYLFSITFFYLTFFDKVKFSLKYFYDRKDYLDSIHFQSLYPSLEKSSNNENSLIKKQEAIGVCVNFNHHPDHNGNTLSSILQYYTIINQYMLILTPTSSNEFSPRNLQLFSQFNVFTIPMKTNLFNENSDRFSSDILERKNTVYHVQCEDGRSGQLQHKCLLLCAQFYSFLQNRYSSLRGILYLADDLYFNFGYVYTHPERFSLDEVWSAPWLQLVDIQTGDKGRLGDTWYWWKAKPHLWTSFADFFLSKSNKSEQYRRIFETLYGPKKRLAVGIADLLYLPFADNQLNTFIKVTKEFLHLFPSDIFCEIIFSLLVDTTMSLQGHWPYLNDQHIYNSSINRLNNLSIMMNMEERKLLKNARDPYSSNDDFRQRPCIFNPDGFIWDQNRQNEMLYKKAIVNGNVPQVYLLKPWPFTTEFVHPMKLSNPNQWSSHLWHQGIQQQILQLKIYQKHRIDALS